MPISTGFHTSLMALTAMIVFHHENDKQFGVTSNLDVLQMQLLGQGVQHSPPPFL